MKKISEAVTKELKNAMDSKTLAGGGNIATADIHSIGFVTKFDVQTSLMPKSERNSDGKFVEVRDENDKPIMQNVSFPVLTATVNDKAGSTIPCGAVLRGLGCIGALNETHLQNILDTYGDAPVNVECDETTGRKILRPIGATVQPVATETKPAKPAKKGNK